MPPQRITVTAHRGRKGKRFTYIIRHAKSDYYKIGQTIDLEKRLETFRAGNPEVLTPIFFIYQPGNTSPLIEKRLHNLLQHRRMRGEWFNLPELNEEPQGAVFKWLSGIGFDATLQDDRLTIETSEIKRPAKSAQEEVDASVILFLNARQNNGASSTSVRDFLVGLPQYLYDDIVKSVYGLVGRGCVETKRVSGHQVGFRLKDKPRKRLGGYL